MDELKISLVHLSIDFAVPSRFFDLTFIGIIESSTPETHKN